MYHNSQSLGSLRQCRIYTINNSMCICCDCKATRNDTSSSVQDPFLDSRPILHPEYTGSCTKCHPPSMVQHPE